MKVLTISIAAYNMEQYLAQCLDSLIDERIIDSLEIFVVDDGSTDRTLEIAEQYAAKYPKSIYPVHKENGGYGTTVNYSIRHATGKYFKLLDGDDWFNTEGLFQLITKLKNVDVDVVITSFCRVYSSTDMQTRGCKEMVSGQIISVNKIGKKEIYEMHSLSYKTEILRVSGLNLPAHILYTDTIYATFPFACCKTALFLDYRVYCYRIGREGQSIERMSKIKHLNDFINIMERLCIFYENQQKEENENLDYVKLRCVIFYLRVIHVILQMPVTQSSFHKLKDYESKMYKSYPDIYMAAGSYGKTGRLITLFRKTNYITYWLLKLIPGGFPYRV